jgi:hypothetical protein
MVSMQELQGRKTGALGGADRDAREITIRSLECADPADSGKPFRGASAAPPAFASDNDNDMTAIGIKARTGANLPLALRQKYHNHHAA